MLKYAAASVGSVALAAAAPKDAAAVDAQCPAAPFGVFLYASAAVSVTTKNSCADVQSEIKARADPKSGWVDPHNAGTYTLVKEEAGKASTLTRLTGDKQFTDKMTFTFADASDGGCQIAACSNSQSNSYIDASTNYCNLRNLYCGTADGCKPAVNDIVMKETLGTFSKGAGQEKQLCLTR